MHEELEAMQEKLATVGANMEHLTRSLDALVAELRMTNVNVQQLTLNQARLEERVQRFGGEIWTSDNGSRIRALELRVHGLYALVLFLVAGIGGELWAILSRWKNFVGF